MDETKTKDRTDDRMNIDDGVVVGSQTVAYNNPVTVLFRGPRSFSKYFDKDTMASHDVGYEKFSKAHGVIADW